jgi:hypothetical protein
MSANLTLGGREMPEIETSDGFAKAAESMRALAAKVDPSEKDVYLRIAERFEEVDVRGKTVFAEVNDAVARNMKFAEQLHRRRFTHRTWEFWVVVGVVLLILCSAKYLV